MLNLELPLVVYLQDTYITYVVSNNRILVLSVSIYKIVCQTNNVMKIVYIFKCQVLSYNQIIDYKFVAISRCEWSCLFLTTITTSTIRGWSDSVTFLSLKFLCYICFVGQIFNVQDIPAHLHWMVSHCILKYGTWCLINSKIVKKILVYNIFEVAHFTIHLRNLLKTGVACLFFVGGCRK